MLVVLAVTNFAGFNPKHAESWLGFVPSGNAGFDPDLEEARVNYKQGRS